MAVWPGVDLDLYWPHGDLDRRAQYLHLADSVRRERRLLNTVLMLPRRRLGGLDPFGRALVRAGRDADRLGAARCGAAARGGRLLPPRVVDTVYVSEQTPSPASRVTLTDERDALGLRPSS